MKPIIYFDQNALSELRERKRKDQQEFKKIYDFLEKGKAFTFYSYTHLDEINNIPLQIYQDEHIDILSAIHAVYIKPMDGRIDARSPHIIWSEYLHNNIENDIGGVNDVELAFEVLGKKISGLSVKDSFSQINESIQKNALSLIKQVEDDLLEISSDELALFGTSIKEIKACISELKHQAQKMPALNIPENEELGPIVFRQWLQKNGIEMSQVPEGEVINTIHSLFLNANGHAIDQDFCDGDILSMIAKSYTLMNWAGYYPDDFTKQKKGKDRFKASQYDLNHVAYAAVCTYLVSSDKNFSRKAAACYAYIGKKVKVVTPKYLIENCLI